MSTDDPQRKLDSSETTKASEPKREPHPEPPAPLVTHHAIDVDGEPLRYSVSTGLMPLRNEAGEIEAEIFFMAYTLDTGVETAKRPLMFSFNGGPGSSSVWLHLGALGPRRVRMLDDGNLPPPPYILEDNPTTWLRHTDLVFIDPVGTGYSRPVKKEDGKAFWSVDGDIASIGEFIRLYLSRNKRWNSPLYLVGESYGTTRAAGLSDVLIEKGIALNGIVLVSSILNFQTVLFDAGNDLPYIVHLPTYAATAWYHRCLANELSHDLQTTLNEVEAWALNEYAAALAKGSRLSDEERTEVVRRLSRYTGLNETFIRNSDLRIEINRFCSELLRDRGETVGRLDTRIKCMSIVNVRETPEFDPSMTAIRPPYTAVFNHYVRHDLGYETDREYYILGGGIKSPWSWGSKMGYPDTTEALERAFVKNPYMRLFVASGYYDLATPYFATRYTLDHLRLAKAVRDGIVMADYEAGHMMYIHTGCLTKLNGEVAKFLGGEQVF